MVLDTGPLLSSATIYFLILAAAVPYCYRYACQLHVECGGAPGHTAAAAAWELPNAKLVLDYLNSFRTLGS